MGVYFRVPDAEPVFVGHYRHAHAEMSAAEAARLIMEAPDPRGYEVLVASDGVGAIKQLQRRGLAAVKRELAKKRVTL